MDVVEEMLEDALEKAVVGYFFPSSVLKGAKLILMRCLRMPSPSKRLSSLVLQSPMKSSNTFPAKRPTESTEMIEFQGWLVGL